MERYEVGEVLGDGTYGRVWKALDLQTGETVALKAIKRACATWDECLSQREVQSLRAMHHPAIVKLKTVFRDSNRAYLVFEHMDCNLYQLISDRERRFDEALIKRWAFQVLGGLAHIHGLGYFHRDLKPENLLVSGAKHRTVPVPHSHPPGHHASNTAGHTATHMNHTHAYGNGGGEFHASNVKIADFGLARRVDAPPPYTDYVSTRWYRAPEILLRAPTYGPPVDVFALGAILAELITLRPLFPGATEMDTLSKVCAVMGPPSATDWAEGQHLAASMGFAFPRGKRPALAAAVPGASPDTLDLLSWMCAWDPAVRPTALQAMQHPFFQGHKVPRSPVAARALVPALQCSSAALRQRLHSDIAGALPCRGTGLGQLTLASSSCPNGSEQAHASATAAACRAATEQRRLAAIYVATDRPPAKQRRKAKHVEHAQQQKDHAPKPQESTKAAPGGNAGSGSLIHLEVAAGAAAASAALQAAAVPAPGRPAPGGPYLNTRAAGRRQRAAAGRNGAATQAPAASCTAAAAASETEGLAGTDTRPSPPKARHHMQAGAAERLAMYRH